MNGNDIQNAGRITATTCVNTPCVDSVGVGSNIEIGPSAGEVQVKAPLNVDEISSQTTDAISITDRLVDTGKRTIISTSPRVLSAAEVVNGIITCSGSASSVTLPNEIEIVNYIGTILQNTTDQTKFTTTFINQTTSNITINSGVDFLAGTIAGKPLFPDKCREITFLYLDNSSDTIASLSVLETDYNTTGDQVVQRDLEVTRDLTVTEDTTINGELKVDTINATTGGGSVTIEGTELSATGTDVLVKLGDIGGAPSTSTSKVVVEGRQQCNFIIQSDWDGGGPSSDSRYVNSLDNNTYQSCFGLENDGTVSVQNSAVGGSTNNIEFRVNGSHTRATNPEDANTPAGFNTPLTIRGDNQNVQLSANTSLEMDGAIDIGDSTTSSNSFTDITIGKGATSATGNNSITIGSNASGSGTSAISIGQNTTTTFTDSISIGTNADTSGYIGAVSIGAQSKALGANNVTVGYRSGDAMTAANRNTIIGGQAGRIITTGAENTIVGEQANMTFATDSDAVVVGKSATGSGNSTVIGYQADATQPNCVCIGRGATSTAANQFVLGSAGFALNTSNTATAGAQTLPANPLGFLECNLNGAVVKIPYYNV